MPGNVRAGLDPERDHIFLTEAEEEKREGDPGNRAKNDQATNLSGPPARISLIKGGKPRSDVRSPADGRTVGRQ